MNIQDIQQLVRQGFTAWESLGDVKVVDYEGMLLFNYRRPEEWNDFEIMCRGLIIQKDTGEIIARSFDKFFNWLEGGRKGTGHIVTVTEKIDGSMGIVYCDPNDNTLRVATRGSFVSDQAIWASEKLYDYNIPALREVVKTHTPIVEIVYPDNQIIVDYGNKQELVLLAARHKLSGNYMEMFPALYELGIRLNMPTPQTHNFSSLTNIIAATGRVRENIVEGWVVEMSDGTRWKFKTDDYLEAHKIVTGITPKKVLKWYLDHLAIGEPPPAYDQYKAAYDAALTTAMNKYGPLVTEIDDLWRQSPGEHVSRKEFAAWVKEHAYHYSAALFDLYDSKDPSYLIADRYVEW